MHSYQFQHQQRHSPIKFTGSCFRCLKPGHYANSCPENPLNRIPVSSPVFSDEQFPAIHCRCGAGFCKIKISGSIKNPNRKYFNCPGENEMNCSYFRWCDELKREEIREVQPKKYPICACGAGVCSVMVEENGVNAGRSYFVCRIKKGDGACNFRQWLDNSPESALVTSESPAADQTTIMDEFNLSYEAEMQLDAIEKVACETPVKGDKAHMEGEEEEMPSEACPRPYPYPYQYPYSYPVDNNVSETINSKMTSQSSDALTNQMCTSQGSFPNLNQVPENLPPLDAQPRGGLLSNPPSLLKNGLHEATNMTSTILTAFEQLALHLQNDLITLLESMSPQNHKSMRKEADCTFTALNSLQVDCKPFQLRVNEYIKQAATRAHIEQIINEDTSSQELVIHRNNEQLRFEELLKAHHEARVAFMASNTQLSLLCERASCLDSSVESAMELSSCEAENAGHRETLLQITKTMAECKESLQAASQKAEEALKKFKEREMERNAAQVAFQTARAQLRN